jgi:anaerobic ribonucleoside-triphosphate reductase
MKRLEKYVRPVVRGKWKKRMEENETPYYKSFTPIWPCSECGTEYDPSLCMTINFCPNCGADMREG